MKLYLPVAALLLTACHGTSVKHATTAPDDWLARQGALTALQSWSLQARIRVRNGGEVHIGKINWLQAGNHYVLDVASPMGNASHRLMASPTEITWQGPDGYVLHAEDTGALMQAELGWSVPLSGARYWVIGSPDPSLPTDAIGFDTTGRLRVFNQAGWEVRIEDYLQVEALELPTRLELTHRDGLELRLAIHRWQLGGNQ